MNTPITPHETNIQDTTTQTAATRDHATGALSGEARRDPSAGGQTGRTLDERNGEGNRHEQNGEALKVSPEVPEVQIPVFRISYDVLKRILNCIGKMPAEHGGALGGEEASDEIRHFHFDTGAQRSGSTYSPDTNELNRLFRDEWKPSNIRLKGFVHSHPGRFGRPSGGDEVYAQRIMEAIPELKVLWLPIVNTIPDTGTFTLNPWAAVMQNGRVRILQGKVEVLDLPAPLGGEETPAQQNWGVGGVMDKITIVPEVRQPVFPALSGALTEPRFRPRLPGKALVGNLIGKCAPSRALPLPASPMEFRAYKAPFLQRGFFQPRAYDRFQRVRGAYDLGMMSTSRVIAVGTGGAAEWLEQLARAGLGQFVLIDPDTVSGTNLGTQQTYRRDIGKSKVHVLAKRLLQINPEAKILPLQQRLEAFSDAQIEAMAWQPIGGHRPVRTVVAGLTDNFMAQARVNRIALNLGLPSLCAQVYEQGRGGEVTFTYPGVTPACNRCALSSRYRHYLENGYQNKVTSDGTPIFATTRLNALKGFVMLALLHHGSSHPRWGTLLSRIGKRNLVLLRMDPDYSEFFGLKHFDKAFAQADRERILFDDVLWLPQDAENPDNGHAHCPDCGGTGDLRKAIGTLENTQLPGLSDPAAPKAF